MSDRNDSTSQEWRLTRREILFRSGLAVTGVAAGTGLSNEPQKDAGSILTFGMVTDLHYAKTAARRDRHFRESILKLNEAVVLMNTKQVDFMVELGDFKDQTEPASEEQALQDLRDIEAAYARFDGPRYHVLGNHDMDCISKHQFLARVQNHGIKPDASYYSFDQSNIHFAVLDANYTSDGEDYDHNNFKWNDANISEEQCEWLENDLAATRRPTVVFIHQQLDENEGFTVSNAVKVRQILEHSGNVLAVFQGHFHEGSHNQINGIHYYTLRAAVDGSGTANNAYAIVDIMADHRIIVSGYRKAVSSLLNPA